MANVKDVMRDVVAFVDGRSYAGQCNQVTLPSTAIQTEEMRAGGMDGPEEMDMGLAAMRASLQFMSVPAEVLKLLGKPDIQITVRGALRSSDASVKKATATMSGKFIENNPGNWQPGQTANFTTTFSAYAYKLTIAGETIHDINNRTYKRVIDGVDQLAALRAALGL